ncbi:MAG TPA: CheR family methyltransferase [Acidobacteriota bacterium]|nr:CheR family methyltransferase [Acidobacteriota bacterium]
MANLAHIYFQGTEAEPRDSGVAAGSDTLRVRFRPAAPLSQHPFDAPPRHDPLLSWLLRQAGLTARAYRPHALERRLAACLRQLGSPTRTAALEALAARPDLVDSALNTVLIGVTDFFRDRAVWDEFAQRLLPELLSTRRGLRVYAAGASTGNELYSMGMLLAEAGVLAGSDLCGLDCRPDAIAAARAGIYSEAALARVPLEWRERYFVPTWGGAQVRPTLARALRWHVGNLFAFEELATWDVILFRNVAIYLEESYATRAWEYLCDQLSPGGVLMTGKAEKPPHYLPLRRIAPALYQRIAE